MVKMIIRQQLEQVLSMTSSKSVLQLSNLVPQASSSERAGCCNHVALIILLATTYQIFIDISIGHVATRVYK